MTPILRTAALLATGLPFVSAPARAAQDPDLSLRLYRAAIAAADAQLRLHATDLAQNWLAEAPQQHRGWEWRYLAARSDESARSVDVHQGTITDLAVSPDGTIVASASGDGTARLLNAATGATLHELAGHTASVWSPSFSHDGARLATASSDGTLRIWDVAGGGQLASMPDNGRGVAATAWSPDDAMVVVVSWGLREGSGVYGKVRVWDAATATLVHDLEHGIKPLASVAWSADGSRVAVGSWDSEVAIYDTATWSEPRLLYPEKNEHYQAVRDLDFAPAGAGGRRLAVSYADGRVRLWDVDAGTRLLVLDTSVEGHFKEVHDVAFVGDAMLATAGEDLTVRLWGATDGRPLAVHHGHARTITTVAAAPDGSALFSAGADHTIKTWDLTALAPARTTWRLASPAYSIAFDPTGARTVSAAYEGHIRIHDVATGAELVAWKGHDASGVGADWSPDGRLVATTGNDGRVVLWEAATGKQVHELCDARGQIETVAFRPGGGLVAAPVPAPQPADGGAAAGSDTIHLWSPESGELVTTLDVDGENARHPVWSPDGRVLAVAYTSGRARLWDAEAREVLAVLEAGPGHARPPAFTADGSVLATAAGSLVRLWDTASGTLLRELPPRASSVLTLAFSPDARRLAAGLANHTLEILDPDDGTVLLRREYASSVWVVRWHGSGEALFVVPLDDTIRVLETR